MKTSIYVRTQFAGIHNWPNAPDEVAFLRNPHRHIFHVKVTIPVTHVDRQYEFFMVKKRIDKYISLLLNFTKNQCGIPILGSMSCERIATEILSFLRQEYTEVEGIKVEVNEDMENGAFVED